MLCAYKGKLHFTFARLTNIVSLGSVYPIFHHLSAWQILTASVQYQLVMTVLWKVMELLGIRKERYR